MSKFINKAQVSRILHFFKIWWIAFLVVYLGMYCARLLGLNSFQHWYYCTWYPLVRNAGSWLTSWVPIPMIHLYAILIVIWLVSIIAKITTKHYLQGLKSLLCGLILMFTSFYVLWGFNYSVPTFIERLHIEVENPDSLWIVNNLIAQVDLLTSLRAQLSSSTLNQPIDPTSIDQALHQYFDGVNNAKPSIPYIKHEGIAIQQLKYGQLLRLETSGIYLSQTFQGHVDASLTNVQKPFTIAHETLHGYGIASESDCNLLAYLALKDSEDLQLKYSAEMAYYRYLAFEIIPLDRPLYDSIRSSLSERVQDDLNAINASLRLYPPLLGPIKDQIYSTYLTSNGIADGLENYSHFVKVIYSMETSD